jgi:putative tryptophan/tyrosine transport system substrate-binding protein
MRRRDVLGVTAGVAVWSIVARAQHQTTRVVGFLSSSTLTSYAPFVATFVQGLAETGYATGENVAIEFRWAEGNYDRLPEMIDDLVSRKVDVIVAQSDSSALAAKKATSTIPIVFGAGDPIAAGLVTSLARPTENLTGISILTTQLNPKRLDFLLELVPRARAIGFLVNPNNPNSGIIVRDVTQAAVERDIQLRIVNAASASEFDNAFASFIEAQVNALLVGNDPFFFSQREALVKLAARHALPAMYEWREFTTAGGLMSYGANLPSMYRKVGIYVGRILNGAKPSELPVQQPTVFELVINLKTAKAPDLTVPPMLLARADEVIE